MSHGINNVNKLMIEIERVCYNNYSIAFLLSLRIFYYNLPSLYAANIDRIFQIYISEKFLVLII